jgi:hypothetical protein
VQLLSAVLQQLRAMLILHPLAGRYQHVQVQNHMMWHHAEGLIWCTMMLELSKTGTQTGCAACRLPHTDSALCCL